MSDHRLGLGRGGRRRVALLAGGVGWNDRPGPVQQRCLAVGSRLRQHVLRRDRGREQGRLPGGKLSCF